MQSQTLTRHLAVFSEYHLILFIKRIQLPAYDMKIYFCFQVYWKDKIMTKFGNSRRRSDENLPEVLARKRKRQDTATTPAINVNSPLMFGLAKYLPERPESEDDHSIKMHKEWMSNEATLQL